MKLGLITATVNLVALVPLALGATGCSFSSNPFGGDPPAADGGTPANEPPHALATITIGESHVTTNSTNGSTTVFTPQVSASFIPDSSQGGQCTQTISGCTIAAEPQCTAATGLCNADQVCVFNASCQPTCQIACTVECPAGQACYSPTPTTQACQPIQSFDAGDLILSGSGIASAVTLVPPEYDFSGTSLTNPLVWGSMIQVTSSGAAGAGFQPFQETVKATTLLTTSPALSSLTAANVYNGAGLALGWTPGNDAIVVSISGPTGKTATCPATDSNGAFTVPPEVVTAVAGTGSPAISIAVARQHMEQKTDGKTQGSLTGETVQPVGFLDLSTISMETYTVEGCGSTATMCSDGCVDLETSVTDCGACGHSCTSGYCESGVCSGSTGQCVSPNTQCTSGCVDLETSPTNCGYCGYGCPTGDYCVNGVCSDSVTCASPNVTCSDGCQNLQTSSSDCGECGNSCDGGVCSGGICQTSGGNCATCEASAEETSGTCASQYAACNGDANCGNFSNCMSGCTAGDTSCQSLCEEDYSTGASEAQSLQICVCQTACASSCSTATVCTQTL